MKGAVDIRKDNIAKYLTNFGGSSSSLSFTLKLNSEPRKRGWYNIMTILTGRYYPYSVLPSIYLYWNHYIRFQFYYGNNRSVYYITLPPPQVGKEYRVEFSQKAVAEFGITLICAKISGSKPQCVANSNPISFKVAMLMLTDSYSYNIGQIGAITDLKLTSE